MGGWVEGWVDEWKEGRNGGWTGNPNRKKELNTHIHKHRGTHTRASTHAHTDTHSYTYGALIKQEIYCFIILLSFIAMEINYDFAKVEKASRQLILDEDEIQNIGNEVLEYICRFWSNLPRYKSFEKDISSSAKIFEENIVGDGRSLKFVLQLFDNSVIHSGIQPASGGFLGYIPGGGIPLSAFGDFIAASTNKFPTVYTTGPGAVNIENHILEWVASLYGYDKERFGGNLTTGSSVGMVVCFAAARDKHRIKGINYVHTSIYTSSHAHFCVQKALKLIGLDECVLRNIPVDSNYCINTSILQETMDKDTSNGLNPFLIVGTIGTTSTGSIDDIDQLSILAKKYNCWLHVDGAYGGFFYLLEEMKNKFRGIEKSDSLTLDPHKSLFMPFGSGIVLVREREDLHRTFGYSSTLIDNSDNRKQSPADLSPELSRSFRGLRLWLPLLYHGVDVFKDALREKIMLTKYAYDKMKTFKFIELGPYPQLTVFIFRYNGKGINNNQLNSVGDLNKLNEEMNEIFQDDGRIYFSTAR